MRNQQPGESVTIWDEAGQVRIVTRQLRPLQVGNRIEAIGYPVLQGIDRVLLDGLYRLAATNTSHRFAVAPGGTKLRLADQVRSLDQDSFAQQPAVSLEGVVTWVDFRTNFIYVLDSSGGIRVMQSQLQNGKRIQTGMLVKVDGVAAAGNSPPSLPMP